MIRPVNDTRISRNFEDKEERIREATKEGLLRLGIIGSLHSIEEPIQEYASAHSEIVKYRVPVTSDYLSEADLMVLEDEYRVIDRISGAFDKDVEDDTKRVLVYDRNKMLIPHIVEVSKDDELKLHIAFQDSISYLRNRISNLIPWLLATIFILSLLVIAVGYFLNLSFNILIFIFSISMFIIFVLHIIIQLLIYRHHLR